VFATVITLVIVPAAYGVIDAMEKEALGLGYPEIA